MSRSFFAVLLLFALFALGEAANAQGTLFDTYFQAGMKASDAKDHATAARHFSAALSAAEETWGPSAHNTIASAINLGRAYSFQGNQKAAQAAFTKAYTGSVNFTTDEQRDLAISAASQLGRSLNLQSRYDDAIPILKWGVTVQEKKGFNDEGAIYLLNQMGHSFKGREKYSEAVDYFAQAWRVSEKVLGKEAPLTFDMHSNLAWAKHLQKDYTGATEEYTDLIRAMKDSVTRDGTTLANIYVDYSRTLRAQKKLEESEKAVRSAIDLYKSLGESELSLVNALQRLASMDYDRKQFEQGDEIERECLSILEKKLDAKALELCEHLQKLGWSLSQQKKFEGAEPILRRELEIRAVKEGDDHENLAYSTDLLASVLANLKRFDEAEQAYRKALKIRKKADKPDEIASAIASLASLFEKQNKPLEAEKVFDDALREQEAAIGSNSPRLAYLMRNVAFFYSRLGKNDKAEELLKKALANRERGLPADHLEIAESLEDLGDFYEHLSRYSESEVMHRRALAIREKKVGKEDYLTAKSESDLAWVLHRVSRYDEALPFARHALGVMERTQGKDSVYVSSVCNHLAGVLVGLNQLNEAEQLYKRALEIDEREGDVYGANIAIHNLALVYQELGRLSEASTMLKRCLDREEATEKDTSPASVTNRLLRLANLARNYGNLGRVELSLGNVEEAKRLFEKQLALAENELAAEHQLVAGALGGLSDIAQTVGDFANADALESRATAIIEKAYGDESVKMAYQHHSTSYLRRLQGKFDDSSKLLEKARAKYAQSKLTETAQVSLNDDLGQIRMVQGKWNDAEKLYKEFIAIWEKAGVYHPTIVSGLVGLANLRREQGRLEDADGLLKRAQEIIQRNYGADDLHMVWIELARAKLLMVNNDLAKAKEAAGHALAIDSKVFGAGHFQTHWALLEVTNVEIRANRFPEALDALQGAERSVDGRLPKDHFFYADMELARARILQGEGKRQEAKEACNKAMEIARVVFGADSYQVAEVCLELAKVELGTGNLDESEAQARKSLLIRDSVIGKESFLSAEASFEIGRVLREKSKLEESQAALEQCLKTREKLLIKGHSLITVVVEELAQVLEKQGNVEEAKSLRAKYPAANLKGE